jgi:hypothetical protein
MVLVYGAPDDLCSCGVHEALQQRGIEVIRLRGPEELARMGLHWSLDEGWDRSYLAPGGERIPLAHLSGVLLRAQPAPRGSMESAGEDQQYIAAERRAAMVAFWNALPCRVVNRPVPGSLRRPLFGAAAAPSIRRCGFRLPAMCLCSSAEEAIPFYRRCGQRALLSSPSGSGLWRMVQGKQGIGEVEEALTRHPVTLQELPDGEGLRVFTVGDQAFGMRAPLGLGVGRGGEGSVRSAELSPALRARCCQLARAFGLDFAEIQLLHGERGETYCLDLGIMPDYARCEEALQEQITAALVTLLLGQEERSADDPASRHPGRSGHGLRLHAAIGR